METSLAATPTNVQVDSTKDNSMQSKEMDEMQMSVAHMPANTRDSESDRAETLSEPEGGTAEWTTDQSDSARDEKLLMPSVSGMAEMKIPGGDESSTAELEMKSETESGTVKIEMASENLSGKAELEVPVKTRVAQLRSRCQVRIECRI